MELEALDSFCEVVFGRDHRGEEERARRETAEPIVACAITAGRPLFCSQKLQERTTIVLPAADLIWLELAGAKKRTSRRRVVGVFRRGSGEQTHARARCGSGKGGARSFEEGTRCARRGASPFFFATGLFTGEVGAPLGTRDAERGYRRGRRGCSSTKHVCATLLDERTRMSSKLKKRKCWLAAGPAGPRGGLEERKKGGGANDVAVPSRRVGASSAGRSWGKERKVKGKHTALKGQATNQGGKTHKNITKLLQAASAVGSAAGACFFLPPNAV